MELTEKQIATKRAIVKHLLEEKEASYKNMMEAQTSDLESAEESNEDQDHVFDDGNVGQSLDRVAARSSVVEALQNDITLLRGIESIVPTEEVQLGDIIETDRGNFFVAVPAGDFVVDGVHYHGISASSPLFQALKGKHNGDKVVVNGNIFVLKNSY
jgi:transcription elongation GreA/GreB family factor